MTSEESRPAGDEHRSQDGQCRILLAEDNLINQRVCEEMLRRLGVNVETVTDGHQAVAAVAEQRYDAVLMDCQMPELDGYRATAQIRAQERSLGRDRVPIIALTAHAMDGDRETCIEAGMDDYLAKPFRLSGLREVLVRWLPGRPIDDPSQPG